MSKVLVVDDEPLICELIGDFLRDELGAIVECAHSGAEGADALLRGRYDLALIDVMLPGVSGLDLAAIAANEYIPVLIMSGHPETNLVLRQFGYPYLPKPFPLAELQVLAAKQMSEHRENVARVKASVARMAANKTALAVALAESNRLMDTLRRTQGPGRWGETIHVVPATEEECG